MDKEKRINRHKEICLEIHELYVLKNKKYGNSFSKTFEEYGPAMICIRLDDKLGRAKQILLHNQEDTEDERIQDTLMDLANYAIMGIIELEGEISEG